MNTAVLVEFVCEHQPHSECNMPGTAVYDVVYDTLAGNSGTVVVPWCSGL